MAEDNAPQGERIAKLIAEGRVALDGEKVTTPAIKVGENQVRVSCGKKFTSTSRALTRPMPAPTKTSLRKCEVSRARVSPSQSARANHSTASCGHSAVAMVATHMIVSA